MDDNHFLEDPKVSFEEDKSKWRNLAQQHRTAGEDLLFAYATQVLGSINMYEDALNGTS